MEVLCRGLGSFFTAGILVLWLTPRWIKFLKGRKWEQTLRDRSEVRDLATLHGAKAHTPTLGGVLIWLATVLATLLWARNNWLTALALFVFTAFGGIGFADDFSKIFHRNSRGISGKKRLIVQFGIAAIFLALVKLGDATHYHALHQVWLPAVPRPVLGHLPAIFFFPLAFLVLSGTANGVNLTDGADGLAAGCVLIAAIPFLFFCYNGGQFDLATRLGIAWVPGSAELAVVTAALMGALVGFLWYNAPPASIFMGDTGSLAIGGLLGAMALLIQQPFMLPIVGGIFVLESLSVIGQVYFFKLTGGRRILRMAPIHHHFELGGCPETRLVIRFWAASLFLAALGLVLHFSRG